MANPRIAPQSLEAEQSTLGACLMDADALGVAMEMLAANDFYRELHKTIFAVMVSLSGAGTEVDLFSIAEELRRSGKLEDVGGSEYLSALIEACASSVNVASYARVVLEKSERRALIEAARDIENAGFDDAAPMPELKSRAEQLILGASRERATGECVSVREVAVSVIASLENQLRNKGQIVGHSTGFLDLDRKMGGYRSNHLVVLGARPGMGKSAFALQSAYAVAKSGVPALVFEFEMSREELVQRLACNVAQVGFQRMERGLLVDEEIGTVIQAVREIERVPLFIQDTSEMTTLGMRSRARRIESEHGQIGLIVVDYLQIVADAAGKSGQGSRADALGKIARECHIMGGERGCTVMALAQLSREVERREDKRPILSDLRDSGSIEAEANRVLFLYREGYYRKNAASMDSENAPTSRANDWQSAARGGGDEDSIAEVVIAKNRNGPTGTVRLAWAGPCVRFDNLAVAQ